MDVYGHNENDDEPGVFDSVSNWILELPEDYALPGSEAFVVILGALAFAYVCRLYRRYRASVL